MKKKLMIAGAVLAVIVVVIVIVLANLNGLINRNKDRFLAMAQEKLGRQVLVEEIGVSLRGGLGVRLRNFQLADDPAFSEEPFIEASALQVDAKLIPLFRKEFQVKRVTLDEPVIRVIRNEHGVLNTSTLGAPLRGDARAPNGSLGQAVETGTAAALPFMISLANVKRGVVYFVDKKSGLEMEITQIDAKLSDLDFKKPLHIAIKAAVLSERQNLDVKGEVGPAGQPPDMMKAPVNMTLQLETPLLAELEARLPKLAAAMPESLTVEGGALATVNASGTPSSLAIESTVDATAVTASLPGRFHKDSGVPLTLTARAATSPDGIDIADLSLTLGEFQLGGRGRVSLTPAPFVDITLDAKEAPLAGWEKLLPLYRGYGLGGMADVHARIEGDMRAGALPWVSGSVMISKGRAKLPQIAGPIRDLEARIDFSREHAEIKDASLHVGRSEIRGSVKVDRFAPMSAEYRVTSPELALSDVKPPNPSAKKPEVIRNLVARGTVTGAGATATNTGKLTSRGGTVADFDYSNMRASFSMAGNEVVLDTITLNAFDGSLRGTGRMTLDETAPSFTLQSRARGVDVAKLLGNYLIGADVPLYGAVNMDLTVSGSGNEWKDIQTTLTGSGVGEVLDGTIIDLNVAREVIQSITQLPGLSNLVTRELSQKYPKVFTAKGTDFSDLKGDFVLQKGKLHVKGLRMNAGDYRVRAGGAIGLDRSLELKTTLTASQALTSDIIRSMAEAKYLKNDEGLIEIPFHLSGTLPAVQASADQQFLSDVAQRFLLDKGMDKGLGDLLKPFKKKKKE